MRLALPPNAAAWNHLGARSGFEVAFFRRKGTGIIIEGRTTAREASALWSVGYEIAVDDAWTTTTVRATSLTAAGTREVRLIRDSRGGWSVDGTPAPELDGCVDVDFASSAMTNMLPVHRIDFILGESVDVPAAFVRAEDLGVQRLEQRYTLTSVSAETVNFHYESSTFDFVCELDYDAAGFVLSYPGIAVRV